MDNVVLEKTKNHITKLAHIDSLDINQELFTSGLLTSLDVLDILLFIETNFGVSIETEDIDEHSFNTISNLTNLILSKKDET